MWDNPRALTAIANLLLAAAVLALAYAGLMVLAWLPAFSLKAVEVTGPLAHVTHDQVESVLQRELSGTFFTVNLAALRSGFEKLPWVRSAEVKRRWPDTLEVVLEEHRVLARWGDAALVNSRGEVFEAAYDGVLPALSGPDGSSQEVARQYQRFSRLLAPVGLAPTQARLSARRAWRLRTEDGMVLELGREHMEQRLSRFVAAYGDSVGRFKHAVDYVDLRYPHGFAVRLPGTARGAHPRRGA